MGGYETWLGTNRFEPQAAEKMLDTLLEMAAEVLRREVSTERIAIPSQAGVRLTIRRAGRDTRGKD